MAPIGRPSAALASQPPSPSGSIGMNEGMRADWPSGSVNGFQSASSVRKTRPRSTTSASQIVEDGLLGLGQLLDDVIDIRVSRIDPQMALELAVGRGRDPGRAHGRQIDGDAVGLAVVDRGEHSLPAGHGLGSGITCWSR